MKGHLALAVALGTLATAYACWHWMTPAERTGPSAAFASAASGSVRAQSATTLQTRHYAIRSTATPSQTAQVATAVESLHDAYIAFFPDLPVGSGDTKLKMVLYRDQREFKENNRSRPWAPKRITGLPPAMPITPTASPTRTTGWSTRRRTS